MKKKSKAAAEPTLVFYKKVEWEQMAFRRRREEIMVAVSVLLLCVLTIFGWAAVGIGVMCGALHALYKEKKKAIPLQSEAVALRHLLLGRAIRVVFLAGDTAIRVVFLARDTANPAVLHTLRKPEYDIFADLREKRSCRN